MKLTKAMRIRASARINNKTQITSMMSNNPSLNALRKHEKTR